MAIAYPISRAPLLGAATLIGGLAASERLLPYIERPKPPGFVIGRYQGATQAREGFICFPGMQSRAEQWDPWYPYFTSQADTLIANNGCEVSATPPVTLRAIEANGLADLAITLIGASLGCRVLVNCLRLCLAEGVRVHGVVIISGPPTPMHPIWGSTFNREVSRHLHGGLITKAIWRFMTAKAVLKARTEAELADAKRVAKISARNIASSAGLLHEDAEFEDGEFAGIPTLVMERANDHRVMHGIEAWRVPFPQAERYFIPVPGHVTFGDCLPLYIKGMDGWRRRNGLVLESKSLVLAA